MQQKLNNVYVGNLPYTTNEQELESLFSQYGQIVSLNLIRDKETNRLKGFAFIEFSDKQQAADAVEKLNGHEFGGRTLNVSMARARTGGAGGGGGGSRSGGGGSRNGGGGFRNGGGGGGGYHRRDDRDS
jgi:RNA recognition motif-containing protein